MLARILVCKPFRTQPCGGPQTLQKPLRYRQKVFQTPIWCANPFVRKTISETPRMGTVDGLHMGRPPPTCPNGGGGEVLEKQVWGVNSGVQKIISNFCSVLRTSRRKSLSREGGVQLGLTPTPRRGVHSRVTKLKNIWIE